MTELNETNAPSQLPPMKWNAWGAAESAKTLNDGIKGLLKTFLGVEASEDPELTPEDVSIPPSKLARPDRDGLAAIVGEENLLDDHLSRLYRAGGKSTPNLLARRKVEQDAPDAVVVPATEDEIAQVLDFCSKQRIAVIPFSGGTSVVGGLDPNRETFAAVVSLDMRKFDKLIAIDTVSQEATLGAGVSGPAAENLLGEHGFSLGHFPQSFEYATIGGFAATRSSGQDSAGYGRFNQMVVGLRVITPVGALDLGRAPQSAAGPDLRELFIGSEGTLGVITQVRLRVHPIPAVMRYEAWSFPDFQTGSEAVRAVAQTGTGPTVIRLSDEAETGLNLATTDKIGSDEQISGCLAITVFEGTAEHSYNRHAETHELLEKMGGKSLGEAPARSWEQGRFSAPYLRDALLSNGALCETLETATQWSNLTAVKTAVTEAIQSTLVESGTMAIVMCHISHVYQTGASLYFTVIAGQRGDATEQWHKAKVAAGDAIMAAGGTITHHHAVGADHRPWMNTEIGEVGAQILQAVKATLDPAGILNPGKLIP